MFSLYIRKIRILGITAALLFLIGSVPAHAGLVAWWSFDACTPVDDSGNGFDGQIFDNDTNPAALACIDDPINKTKAFGFDGNSHINTSKNTSLREEDEMSLAAWVKPTSDNNTWGHYIVTTGGEDYGAGYAIKWTSYSLIYQVDTATELENGDANPMHLKPRFWFELKRNAATNTFVGSDEHTINRWYCVVATYDDNNEMKLYVDGDLEGSGQHFDNKRMVEEEGVFIGKYTWDFPNNRSFRGGIDEVRIYDHALTHQEIKDYCSESTIIELSLLDAYAWNGTVAIEWETAAEINNAGFNIYRAESAAGPYEKINQTIIPAEGSAVEGSYYRFVDENAENGPQYFYKLEDVDFYGQTTKHGPVSVIP